MAAEQNKFHSPLLELAVSAVQIIEANVLLIESILKIAEQTFPFNCN